MIVYVSTTSISHHHQCCPLYIFVAKQKKTRERLVHASSLSVKVEVTCGCRYHSPARFVTKPATIGWFQLSIKHKDNQLVSNSAWGREGLDFRSSRYHDLVSASNRSFRVRRRTILDRGTTRIQLAGQSSSSSQLKLRESYPAPHISTDRNDSRHLSTASFAALVKGPKFSGARTIIR